MSYGLCYTALRAGRRSLWRGAISFGLIYVPVEVHPAARDGTLHLHLLDRRDFAPVGYERVNKISGKTVPWPEIVKGYEYQKGNYVALSDDDFKHANVKASETIAISRFSEAAEVSPAYFETSYYLAPAKGGGKIYALLRDALSATGNVAIATFVMRGRQHLCLVAPHGRALMLMTLRFAAELLPPDALDLPATAQKGTKFSAEELATAQKLIAGMTSHWNPDEFKDTYRADLMRRIKDKIRKRQTHSLDPEAPATVDRPKAQVIDLMAALRKSLDARGRKANGAGHPARKASKSTRPASKSRRPA